MHRTIKQSARQRHKLPRQQLNGLLAGDGANDGRHAVQLHPAPSHEFRGGILGQVDAGDPRLGQEALGDGMQLRDLALRDLAAVRNGVGGGAPWVTLRSVPDKTGAQLNEERLLASNWFWAKYCIQGKLCFY